MEAGGSPHSLSVNQSWQFANSTLSGSVSFKSVPDCILPYGVRYDPATAWRLGRVCVCVWGGGGVRKGKW